MGDPFTPAEVSYSVQRGEKTAKEEDYQLELMKFEILRSSPFPLIPS